jgi:threonine dehydrogenase-like Zn-dependent dehydrogenase
MTVALAVSSGARVTVVDPHESRRKVAKETFGAAETLTLTEAKDIKESFDVVFECVGRPEAMEQAVDMAKAGGTIVWVGVAKIEDRVSISPFEVYRRELTIRSSYTNHFSMDRALNLLATDRIDWSKLISHTYSLEQFETAWEVFQSKVGIKICVKP